MTSPSVPTGRGQPADPLGLLGRVKLRWLSFGRRDKTLWFVAILLLGVGTTSRPLVGSSYPRIEVAAARGKPGGARWKPRKARGDWKGWFKARDPWGHRLVGRKTRPGFPKQPFIYSVGPNGTDEEGQGDDVLPTPLESRLGERLAGLKGSCIALALLLIWFVHGPDVRTPRSPQLGREVLRALNFSVGLFLFLLPGPVGLVLGRRNLTPYVDAIQNTFPLAVHPVIAIVGTYGMLCFVLALGWRLNQPLEGEDAESSGAGSPQGGVDTRT
jgi:hypothetical protein